MGWLSPSSDGCIVTVKVTPRASKSGFIGADPEWLRVRLQAPPVDGKANVALVAFFADCFDMPKRAVEIVTGDTSRLKRVKLHGISATAVEAAIASLTRS